MIVGTPLLVGESNPHSADPLHALYPSPAGCAGDRLARALRLTERGYLQTFKARVNLLDGVARWSAREARQRAEGIARLWPNDVIMLGRRVAVAFGKGSMPFFSRDGRFVLIPHPSGLCRIWNDPASAERARELLGPYVDLSIPDGYDDICRRRDGR